MTVLPRTRRPPAAFVWAALGSVYLIWGSTYLAIRVVVRTLPPMLSASVRFLIAGALMYWFASRRGDRLADKPGRSQWIAAFFIGATLLLGGNGLVVVAEQHVSSGIAALLIATVPLWMAVVGWAGYRERVKLPVILGLVIGFLGLVVLVTAGRGTLAHVDPLGAALLVGASLSWSIGSLYARRAPLPSRALVGTGMEMLAGGVLLGIVGLLRGELGKFHPSQVQLTSVLAFVYLIVFGSLVAFSAYVWCLRVTSTSIVSTYAYVNPVVAVLLGWWLLREPVTPRTLLSGAIIVAGVALIVSSRPVANEGSPADAPPPTEKR
ncbi:MAG: EamA family transporter [Actinomycetota bacterium]|nr:EamA family transporter [Actinomycetota bacterium]